MWVFVRRISPSPLTEAAGCEAEPLLWRRATSGVDNTAVERLSGPRTAVRWDKYTLR